MSHQEPTAFDVPGKPWWLSRGVWGSAIAIVSIVFSMTGVAVDAGMFVESVLQLIALVGAIFGWWGRVDAKTPIDTQRVVPFERQQDR